MSSRRPRIIDMHCHVHPPEIAKTDPLWPNGDCPICIEALLDSHEKAGIDFAVVTNSLHYLKGKDDKTSLDRKSTRLNSSHVKRPRMPSSA